MKRDDLPISARLADLGYTHEEAKSVWIDGVRAIKESATGRVLREMDALEAACFCLGVEEAKSDRDRLRSELDAAHEEIRLSRESEHETMADLVATRAELARVRRNHLRRTIEACGELYRRAIENSERNCPVYPTAERCITINRKVRQFREHQRATLSRMEAEG